MARSPKRFKTGADAGLPPYPAVHNLTPLIYTYHRLLRETIMLRLMPALLVALLAPRRAFRALLR